MQGNDDAEEGGAPDHISAALRVMCVSLVLGVCSMVFMMDAAFYSEGGFSAVYFLPHARCWELLVGAFLGAAETEFGNTEEDPPRPQQEEPINDPENRDRELVVRTSSDHRELVVRNSLAVLGFFGILQSALVKRSLLNGFGPLPSSQAKALKCVEACVFTSVLIGSGGFVVAAPSGVQKMPVPFVSRVLLGNRFLLFSGRISYSLYLWHWPLIALAIHHSIAVWEPLAGGVLIGLTYLFAYLSFRFVETPLRGRGAARRPPQQNPVPPPRQVAGNDPVAVPDSDQSPEDGRTAQEFLSENPKNRPRIISLYQRLVGDYLAQSFCLLVVSPVLVLALPALIPVRKHEWPTFNGWRDSTPGRHGLSTFGAGATTSREMDGITGASWGPEDLYNGRRPFASAGPEENVRISAGDGQFRAFSSWKAERGRSSNEVSWDVLLLGDSHTMPDFWEPLLQNANLMGTFRAIKFQEKTWYANEFRSLRASWRGGEGRPLALIHALGLEPLGGWHSAAGGDVDRTPYLARLRKLGTPTSEEEATYYIRSVFSLL